MQGSCLPVEVCERIIDASRLNGDEGSGYEVDYPTLCSCTLVCRAWLPRSRGNMFFCVVLHTSRQLKIFLSLASHYPVRELELGPLEPTRYGPDSEIDMGPSIGPLIRANLINEVYLLVFWNMVWPYPRIYLSLLSQLESVKILEMHGMYFPNAGDLLGLLRCFPQLQDLTCEGIGLQFPETVHNKSHHRVKAQQLHRVEVRVLRSEKRSGPH